MVCLIRTLDLLLPATIINRTCIQAVSNWCPSTTNSTVSLNSNSFIPKFLRGFKCIQDFQSLQFILRIRFNFRNKAMSLIITTKATINRCNINLKVYIRRKINHYHLISNSFRYIQAIIKEQSGHKRTAADNSKFWEHRANSEITATNKSTTSKSEEDSKLITIFLSTTCHSHLRWIKSHKWLRAFKMTIFTLAIMKKSKSLKLPLKQNKLPLPTTAHYLHLSLWDQFPSIKITLFKWWERIMTAGKLDSMEFIRGHFLSKSINRSNMQPLRNKTKIFLRTGAWWQTWCHTLYLKVQIIHNTVLPRKWYIWQILIISRGHFPCKKICKTNSMLQLWLETHIQHSHPIHL